MYTTPYNWYERPRYAAMIADLKEVASDYPYESKFALEALAIWVEDLHDFYKTVCQPWEELETIEEMEDYLQGENPDRIWYGDFISDCLNAYEDSEGELGQQNMMEMFEDPRLNKPI